MGDDLRPFLRGSSTLNRNCTRWNAAAHIFQRFSAALARGVRELNVPAFADGTGATVYTGNGCGYGAPYYGGYGYSYPYYGGYSYPYYGYYP